MDINVCIFFFQAEDGIRDLTVTGVQTCALPISCRRTSTAERRPMCADTGLPRYYVRAGNEAVIEGGFVALERALRRATRSEERRVGKECRSRWSPYH